LVYRICCSCGKVYIGQTGREFKSRIDEHLANWQTPFTKNGNPKSGNSFKNHPNPHHIPDFAGAKVVVCESSKEIREVKEAMLICKAGSKAIENENLGQSSSVNRSRGKSFDPCLLPVIARLLEKV